MTVSHDDPGMPEGTTLGTVTVEGIDYEVLSISEPCTLGRSFHYHEEEHDGVPSMVSHHHHGETCQRLRAILVPCNPEVLDPPIVIPASHAISSRFHIVLAPPS